MTATGDAAEADEATEGAEPALASVAVRGGRFLTPLAEALARCSRRTITEFNTVRERRMILIEHSVCLRHAILGVEAEDLAAVAPLGWTAEDFETAFFGEPPGPSPAGSDARGNRSVLVLGAWADATPNLFRHRLSGMMIPFRVIPAMANTDAHRRLSAYIEAEFKPIAYDESEFKFSMRLIFSRVPPGALLFVLLTPELRRGPDGTVQAHRPRVRMNQWCAEAASLYPNVRLINLADFDENGAAPTGPGPEAAITPGAAARMCAHMIAASA